jgi:hypothetical protein
MSRPRTTPTYRLHRQSGQAIVTLPDPDGRQVPVAEQLARWYASMILDVAAIVKPGWKLPSRERLIRMMIPTGWATVRRWRDEAEAEAERNSLFAGFDPDSERQAANLDDD